MQYFIEYRFNPRMEVGIMVKYKWLEKELRAMDPAKLKELRRGCMKENIEVFIRTGSPE